MGQATEFKFESKFKPLQVIWQLLPKAIREDNQVTAKSRAELLGQRSGTASARAGRTGEHKHRAFPSLWQSLWAVTGSLDEKVLPLLRN